MPAKNVYHDAVRDALVADGWTITHEHLRIQVGARSVYIDLAAEHDTLSAVKGDKRIAVEVQSFAGPSDIHSLQQAVGQCVMYQYVLSVRDPDRELFMAVDREAYDNILSEPIGVGMIAEIGIRLIVFDPTTRRIERWTS